MSRKEDCIFIKSSCHAEMRKGVSYTVDIQLDSRGSVKETQCECAAGMGPAAHCKHVSTVLYGAVMFSKKLTIKTEETCTQKLQSFHKCKKFIGSPIKANALDMPGAAELTNIDFDPRPEQFRNAANYQDHFRNACLNFSGISKMPIFQTFEPANTKAIALDHDYLKFSPEDNFLVKTNLTKINAETVSDIEKKTLGQSNNELWKEERSKRLTSSMFGKICKLTDRTDRNKLARSLLETKEIKSAPLEHGCKHESVAVAEFMETTGRTVHNCGLFIAKEYPFLAASPDGIIDSTHVVEVKCPFSARDKPISAVTVPYLNCDDRRNFFLDMNHNYYYQIQGQLLCTGAQTCTLIICTADNLKVKDIKYFDIQRNDTFILKMVSQLEDFFNNHFREALLEKHFYKSY
jgi:putative phage-type endonuclease